MSDHSPATRVGLFALGGLLLLFAVLVAVFGAGVLQSRERAVLHFEGSVHGLQVGAPVVFRGVRLGGVKSVQLVNRNGRIEVPVEVELDAAQLHKLAGGVQDRPEAAQAQPAIPRLVAQGLVAQLVSQSLLTGQMYVELDLQTPTAARPRQVEGVHEIPTVLSQTQGLQQQLERLDLARISEDLAAAMASARGLLGGNQIKQALEDVAAASAATARLASSLETRLAPLASAAQRSLAQATQASARVAQAAELASTAVAGAADRAGDSVSQAASSVASAAASAGEVLQPQGPLLLGVQTAAEELGRTAKALREAASSDAVVVQDLQRALGDVSRSARAVRELAEQLQQQPQSLIRGRAEPP